MPEYITISKKVERKTYIRGRFVGKYMGYIDYDNSNLYHENFYNLEILDGEIILQKNKAQIHRWEDVENEEEVLFNYGFDALPQPIKCTIQEADGSVKHYKIILQEPKLVNCILSKNINETDKVFGDIEGDISGYIVHFDTVEEEIEVKDETPILTSPIHIKHKTNNKTGQKELSRNYIRWEYYYSDGTTYWGEWEWKKQEDTGPTIVEFLTGLFQILILLAIVVPLLVIGWRVILPILAVVVGFYLLSIVANLFIRLLGWLVQIISIGFFIFFIFSLITVFNDTSNHNGSIVSTDTEAEVEKIEYNPISKDSIISHYRIWEDYEGKQYAANIKTRFSDIRAVNSFRNNLSIGFQSTRQYNAVVNQLYEFEKNKLDLLYIEFDSLKTAHQLNATEFAEVIVSCIQDIPYTLILNDACNANLYNDKFIREYLQNGERCEEYVKYGLFSPTEFMANLSGDCDTRTLLLYTVLSHYNYDVIMLGSELYKHAVIGMNLPYTGVFKIINNKKYVLWETTDKGYRPGVLSKEISNTAFWNVTLNSTYN